MTVTYIQHSGFLLETERAYFLFDYYKGQLPEMNDEKAVVVFVSHRHGDHYNPKIFSLIKDNPRVQFILSKDVPVKRQIKKYEEQGISLIHNIIVVGRNEKIEVSLLGGEHLDITTLKSTDEGVAYLIKYGDKNYYHAGDLNLWTWEGEEKQYNNNMKANYFRELEKIKGMDIDVAFIPLDPRQGKEAFKGLETFMEYTRSKIVFPMHFWGNFDIIKEFLEKHPEHTEQICVIEREEQVFHFGE